MHRSENIYLPKFSLNPDHDLFFDEEYFRDIEIDGQMNKITDLTDLDDAEDFFWEEI